MEEDMTKEFPAGENILKREDLDEYLSIDKLNIGEDSNNYLVTLKDKYLIVKRIGKCDYKKCKNVCCKFCSMPYPHEYFEGFGYPSKSFKSLIIKKRCKFLDKDGTCQKWNDKSEEIDNSIGFQGRSKGFPRACKQFPHLNDDVFHEVMDVCTFKYEIIFTINRIGDKIFDEMILNFKKQT